MTGKSRVDLEVLVTLGVVTAGEAHRSGGLHPDGVQELARLLEQVSVVAAVDAERGGFSTHLSLAPEEVATVAARAASARAQAGGGLLHESLAVDPVPVIVRFAPWLVPSCHLLARAGRGVLGLPAHGLVRVARRLGRWGCCRRPGRYGSPQRFLPPVDVRHLYLASLQFVPTPMLTSRGTSRTGRPRSWMPSMASLINGMASTTSASSHSITNSSWIWSTRAAWNSRRAAW